MTRTQPQEQLQLDMAGRAKAVFVAELREEGQDVAEVFLVAERSLRTTQGGKKYLALELADRTGRLQARLWDGAEAAQKEVAVDSFVRVTGTVEYFNGQRQLKLSTIRAVPDGSVDTADFFLPRCRRDAAEMEAELQELLGRIKQPHLGALARGCFEDPAMGPSLRQAPAAKQIHHATIGGLLEHSLAVANLCLHLAGRYGLDADLLVTAALLHDIGKIREYSWDRRVDYTDEGRLIGHLVIGAEVVTQRAGSIDGFPPETLLRLRHMILSHHGQYEWGSPKLPMSPEALALHFADDLDGKLNTAGEFLKLEEAENPDSHWTTYHRTLDRFLFRGSRPDVGTER